MQLLLLDGIAEHAAVHESVELAKRSGRGGAGLVNAVLRRAAREGRGILAELDDDTPADAAIAALGAAVAGRAVVGASSGPTRPGRCCAAINQPAESALRVNTLVASTEPGRGRARRRRPPGARAVPEGLVLAEPFDAFGSELWARGAIMPQSRASMLVARALAPAARRARARPVRRPRRQDDPSGGADGRRGDAHRGRAPSRARRRPAAHPGPPAGHLRHRRGGRRRPSGRAPPAYDRVLVDPPCSGLGTLQSRPDLRWRTSPERIAETAALQARILRAAARATAPGGTVVYSVCTISRREGEEVVDALPGRPSRVRARSPARRGSGSRTASCCPTSTTPTGSSSPGCVAGDG